MKSPRKDSTPTKSIDLTEPEPKDKTPREQPTVVAIGKKGYVDQKYLTIHLPFEDFVNPSEQLQTLFEDFCKSRGMDLNGLETLDKMGNLVGWETQLENIVGGEVILKKKK